MRVVSRDVIEHSSQTHVISSERRNPSVGDIPNRCGTRTNPFRMFRHVTAIPEVAPASPVSVRDEWSSRTVHRVSPTVDSLPTIHESGALYQWHTALRSPDTH